MCTSQTNRNRIRASRTIYINNIILHQRSFVVYGTNSTCFGRFGIRSAQKPNTAPLIIVNGRTALGPHLIKEVIHSSSELPYRFIRMKYRRTSSIILFVKKWLSIALYSRLEICIEQADDGCRNPPIRADSSHPPSFHATHRFLVQSSRAKDELATISVSIAVSDGGESNVIIPRHLQFYPSYALLFHLVLSSRKYAREQ